MRFYFGKTQNENASLTDLKHFILNNIEIPHKETYHMKRIPPFKTISFIIMTFILAMAVFCMPVTAEETDEPVDNGIPVVYINIDESQVTIEQM